MSKMLDYLNHLDKNSAARSAHAADPTAAMTQFGLTHVEQLAAISGDKAKIAELAGVEMRDGELIQFACLKHVE